MWDCCSSWDSVLSKANSDELIMFILMRNAVSAHRENKKNKTQGQISGFIIWSCFWHPRETAFVAEIHFVICTNVLYMYIHYLKPEHTKKDNRTKRSKIQTLRMLFMENTFFPLVLIFSADSAEWPADETLPRHTQHETHKMNLFF